MTETPGDGPARGGPALKAPAPVMTDVARLAGVSLQTVSRVVNDTPHVSGPTRAKVLAAMDQLGYRRNAVARALATRRSGIIGVITFDTLLHGPVRLLYAVDRAACRSGLGVAIAVVDRFDAGSATRAVRRLQDLAVEGVIAVVPNRSSVDVLTTALGPTPAVLLGGAGLDESTTLPAVGIDHRGGAVAATRHLLDLGHRTVHHVAGPQDWPSADRRVEGWRATLDAAGARIPPLVTGDWTAASGHAGMRELLSLDPDVTAVFVANDHMALGALSALAEAGRRVPEDVSVVGFDDEPTAVYYRPPLTTVRQPLTDAAERALHRLLDVIRPEAAGTPLPALVAAELVVRHSTAPPPSR
ncbi:LacI family DNA-binding transcriptional regulator [Pseudonocardia sp.]|uniref:LacI family DNA-binding transcriptional regulator n=1 Tax=Pseudonocardia sp. TaxID=60912 RepID=UPI002627E774|nr:LacI family DNA-binding transcriptional regulator [Pseudonocardia sp.]MCW2720573.1 hypothetical protein [Pseudonocardia sp.]